MASFSKPRARMSRKYGSQAEQIEEVTIVRDEVRATRIVQKRRRMRYQNGGSSRERIVAA